MSRELAGELVDIMGDHGHSIISYDRQTLSALCQCCPGMSLGVITHDIPLPEEIDGWIRVINPRFIFFARHYEPKGAARISRKGTRIGSHVVNSKDDWVKVRRFLGENCLIITDKPEKLLE